MSKKYKLVFTVPLANADECRKAIGEAGAGKYPNYSFCSFSTKGIGRFLPLSGAKPAIGEIGKMEEIEEERIECQVDAEVVDQVLAALKKVHPYEEIAYDLYSLETRD
jgi:hypothetical protein